MGKKISSEEKYNVVRQILRGEISQRYAAEIMGVHWSSVQAWMRLYESEGAAALERNGRNRGYSAETKQAAVQEYLAGKGSLSTVCKKYHIRANVTLRRGKRKAAQEPRTELERLQIENERLKHALYMAEMERDLLKKLEEVERRDSSHK